MQSRHDRIFKTGPDRRASQTLRRRRRLKSPRNRGARSSATVRRRRAYDGSVTFFATAAAPRSHRSRPEQLCRRVPRPTLPTDSVACGYGSFGSRPPPRPPPSDFYDIFFFFFFTPTAVENSTVARGLIFFSPLAVFRFIPFAVVRKRVFHLGRSAATRVAASHPPCPVSVKHVVLIL